MYRKPTFPDPVWPYANRDVLNPAQNREPSHTEQCVNRQTRERVLEHTLTQISENLALICELGVVRDCQTRIIKMKPIVAPV